MVTDAYTPPSFIAPYHPRLDHAILYEASGMNGGNWLGIMTQAAPYNFNRASFWVRLQLRLLEGASNPVHR
jgi:hypothetical protein